MNRLLTLITVLIALVAATMPSAAVSSRGVVESPSAILTPAENGTYLEAPCPLKGSKRLTQCRTDIAVVPVAAAVRPVGQVLDEHAVADPMPRPLVREPSLPPPRLG